MSEKNSSEESQYAKRGVSSSGAKTSLSALLKHVLPTREFSPNFPLAADIGYFANVIDLGNGDGIAFCTDGVGTKIIVAELLNKYDTIGIDCIAMNVNDVICLGARPVSMVDYIACSFTDVAIFEQLGKGLAEGARQSRISISGGEISQISEIITGIDLIGACIGHVKIDRINTGKAVRPGSLVIGLESSGVHSNGLTLARKILLGETPEEQKENVHKFEEKLGRTLGEELLEPTRIYVQPILELIDSGLEIQAMVHITGGGFLNLTRVASDNIRFVIDTLPPTPPVFQLIQDCGEVSDAEMYDVFNMGIGFCVVVEGANEVEQVTEVLKKYDMDCHVIGYVDAHHGKDVTLPEKNLISQNGKFVQTSAE